MKNILLLMALASIIFSCTKTEDGPEIVEDKTAEYGGIRSDASSMGGGGGSGQGGDTIQSGQITAGEWNDLANWDFWNNLGQEEDYVGMPEYWSFNLAERISVKLQNPSSENLVNIKIELMNTMDEVLWTSRTDNFGTVELFPGFNSTVDTPIENLKVRINENTYNFELKTYAEGINNLYINLNQDISPKCDVAFVVDATGSMADELEYLKVELIDVISKVKNSNPDAGINLGSVFYRDNGDDYVTRISEFSSDISKTINFIRNQSADGGGDFPEAVHTALDKAVNNLQWSSNATSRLLFLVLDAPPHYEPQIVTEIHDLVTKASAKGIKVIPVTASGIDKQTEFLMRYMSVATNGSYVFITNDSGIGGEHLEPTIGEYEVELLNELIERLINKYLE